MPVYSRDITSIQPIEKISNNHNVAEQRKNPAEAGYVQQKIYRMEV
jgi:hypothetical protein